MVFNSFTFLLMKLHAFRDRIDGARRDLSAYHALDIYRIVAMLSRDEYDFVKRLAAKHKDTNAVRGAAAIVGSMFFGEASSGVLRLKGESARAGLPASDIQSKELVSVLADLFPPARLH